MKFIVENWYLIVLALVSGALLAVPMLKGAAGGLTAANAVQLINREKAVLIDVCGADEYAAGHAGGAKSVPLGELESRLPNVVKNKAIPVVMMCASGARASRAAAQLRKTGYASVSTLAGGNAAWREASLPIEKSA